MARWNKLGPRRSVADLERLAFLGLSGWFLLDLVLFIWLVDHRLSSLIRIDHPDVDWYFIVAIKSLMNAAGQQILSIELLIRDSIGGLPPQLSLFAAQTLTTALSSLSAQASHDWLDITDKVKLLLLYCNRWWTFDLEEVVFLFGLEGSMTISIHSVIVYEIEEDCIFVNCQTSSLWIWYIHFLRLFITGILTLTVKFRHNLFSLLNNVGFHSGLGCLGTCSCSTSCGFIGALTA